MHRSRELLHERIHRDKRQNPEKSGRAPARKDRFSQNTVTKALGQPMPLKRKKPPRESVLGSVSTISTNRSRNASSRSHHLKATEREYRAAGRS
ncbi:hypothetical protein [Streptomyces sp. NPDC018000]|uniref:hypothetical protein n=1 Tax=Streptomyces sp. NPDC018000 TaxID=3365028 RepID=UPI0037B46696